MKVEKGKTITLEYTITTDKGGLIESSAGRGAPVTFAFGEQSGLPEGLNKHLEGMREGEEDEFELLPEDAFGTEDSGPVISMKRTEFPADADMSIGTRFQGELPGMSQTVNFEIIEHLGENLQVRLIHPLAGKTIRIKAKVIKIDKS